MKTDYVVSGSLNRPIRFSEYKADNEICKLIIIHGMQEHSGRYEETAKSFNDKNISVITFDLRGHGSNQPVRAGYDDGDIYLNIVADCKAIIAKVVEMAGDKKVFVLGHSFGSFVTQRLIKDRVKGVAGYVLSGSTKFCGVVPAFGRVVARLQKIFKGGKSDAKLIEKLSFGAYSKGFEDGNWLTRDNDVWEKYQADPLCGQVFPVSFYYSMFKNVPKNYSRLKNKVGYCPNILVLSGTKDPVGGYTNGVKKLYNVYASAGFNANIKLFDDCRHECLNELNKAEVIGTVVEYIRSLV